MISVKLGFCVLCWYFHFTMARNRPNMTRTGRRPGNKVKMPQYNLKFGDEADEEDSFYLSEKVSLMVA